jgi:hypothetical protein
MLIVFEENPNESIKYKILEPLIAIVRFQDTKSIPKSLIFMYTDKEHLEFEIKHIICTNN